MVVTAALVLLAAIVLVLGSGVHAIEFDFEVSCEDIGNACFSQCGDEDDQCYFACAVAQLSCEEAAGEELSTELICDEVVERCEAKCDEVAGESTAETCKEKVCAKAAVGCEAAIEADGDECDKAFAACEAVCDGAAVCETLCEVAKTACQSGSAAEDPCTTMYSGCTTVCSSVGTRAEDGDDDSDAGDDDASKVSAEECESLCSSALVVCEEYAGEFADYLEENGADIIEGFQATLSGLGDGQAFEASLETARATFTEDSSRRDVEVLSGAVADRVVERWSHLGSTLLRCVRAAAEDPVTLGFVWKPDDGKCFLLHVLRVVDSEEKAFSFTKKATPYSHDGFSLRATGGDEIGGDGRFLSFATSRRRFTSKTATFQQCAELAANDPVTKGFTWWFTKRRCFLLSARKLKSTGNRHVVSFKRTETFNADGFALVGSGGVERGGNGKRYSVKTALVRLIENGSLNDCVASARTEKFVTGFNYFASSKKCQLVNGDGRAQTTSLVASYAKTDPTGKYRFAHSGKKGNGKKWSTKARYVFDYLTDHSVKTCAQACAAHDPVNAGFECLGFVRRSNGKCYLLREVRSTSTTWNARSYGDIV